MRRTQGLSLARCSGLFLKKGTLNQLSLSCLFKDEGYFYPMFTEELSPFHSVYHIEGYRLFVYAAFLNTGNAIDWA